MWRLPAFEHDFTSYVPAPRHAESADIYVVGMGRATITAGSPYPPPGHPEPYDFGWDKGRFLPGFQVVYIASGSGEFESSETGLVRVTAPAAMLLFPGIWHRYRPFPATGWTEHWVSFDGLYPQFLQSTGHLSPAAAVVQLGPDGAASDIFFQMSRCARRLSPVDTEQLGRDTMTLLSILRLAPSRRAATAVDRSPGGGREDPVVAQAMRAIWNTSLGSTTIDEILRGLPLSRRSIERRFRQTLGRTVQDEISRCRIARAKTLLATTKLTMREVAASVGFSGARGMSRTFFTVEGISPSDYRLKTRTPSQLPAGRGAPV